MAVGDVVTFTGTYTTTPANAAAGQVLNTATASGAPPTGPRVTDTDNAVVTITPATPAITLDKSASPAAVVGAGQTITYSFVLTNSGNVPLTGVTLTDPLPGLTITPPAASAWTGGVAGTLPVGGTVTFTGTYTTAAGDVTAGEVENTATASGNPPSGPPVTTTDTVKSSEICTCR